MKKWQILLEGIFLLISSEVIGQSGPGKLEKVVFESISAEQAVLQIKLDREVEYKCMKTNSLTLVVDLLNTEHHWPQKDISVNQEGIKGIRSSQYKDTPQKITRIVVDLRKRLKSYNVERTGEGLLVNITFTSGGTSAGDRPLSPSGNRGTKNLLLGISLEGNQVVLETQGSASYKHFTLKDPPMIVVDLLNTENRLAQKEQEVNGELIKKVRSNQYQKGTTRVVLDLNTASPYEVVREGKKVVVKLAGGNTPSSASEASGELIDITTIDLKDAQGPSPKLVVSAAGVLKIKHYSVKSPPMIIIDLWPAQNKVTEKKMEINQGPIKNIRSSQYRPSITRVVIDLENMLSYTARQEGNDTIIELGQPVPTASDETLAKVEPEIRTDNSEEQKQLVEEIKKEMISPRHQTTTVKGKGVVLPDEIIPSLDFKEADLRDVLRILSLQSGVQMVYGDDVKGLVTIHLEKIKIKDALDVILKISGGFVYEPIAPGVIRIVSPDVLKKDLAGAVTTTKIYTLNYALASEVTIPLQGILTTQGKIQVDIRTNSVIVTDVPDNLKNVEKMISQLDVATKQVMIEAQIVEISANKEKDLGVDWALAATMGDLKIGRTTGAGDQLQITAPPQGTGAIFPGAATASGEVGSFTLGGVLSDLAFRVALSAMASKGESQILSSPKVATLNNKEAKIEVIDKYPYTTTQVSGGIVTQTVAYADIGIKLSVTPTINVDNRITLKISPEVSVFKGYVGGIPVLGTRKADTNVLISDGQTVVIGGLITEEEKDKMTNVPFIGELPILGYFFRRTTDTKDRKELLIFLTPRLIR